MSDAEKTVQQDIKLELTSWMNANIRKLGSTLVNALVRKHEGKTGQVLAVIRISILTKLEGQEEVRNEEHLMALNAVGNSHYKAVSDPLPTADVVKELKKALLKGEVIRAREIINGMSAIHAANALGAILGTPGVGGVLTAAERKTLISNLNLL